MHFMAAERSVCPFSDSITLMLMVWFIGQCCKFTTVAFSIIPVYYEE
jgi:hypothetical protein